MALLLFKEKTRDRRTPRPGATPAADARARAAAARRRGRQATPAAGGRLAARGSRRRARVRLRRLICVPGSWSLVLGPSRVLCPRCADRRYLSGQRRTATEHGPCTKVGPRIQDGPRTKHKGPRTARRHLTAALGPPGSGRQIRRRPATAPRRPSRATPCALTPPNV